MQKCLQNLFEYDIMLQIGNNSIYSINKYANLMEYNCVNKNFESSLHLYSIIKE